jgi:hypothetical protein
MSNKERAQMDRAIREAVQKKYLEKMESRIPDKPVYHGWSEREDLVLRERYRNMTARDIMDWYLPSRTTHQIRARARRLGLAGGGRNG